MAERVGELHTPGVGDGGVTLGGTGRGNGRGMGFRAQRGRLAVVLPSPRTLAREERMLAAVRAVLAATELLAAMLAAAVGAGDLDAAAALLGVPLAISLLTPAALRMARGRTRSLQLLGAVTMAADVVFLVTSLTVAGTPDALAAGWLTRTFVLLEGPVRYGLAGSLLTGVPAVAAASLWSVDVLPSGAGILLTAVPALVAAPVVGTLRRRAHRTRTALDRFEQAFAQAPVGLAVLDLDGSIEQANPSLAALVGEDVDRIQELSFSALLDPAMRERFAAAVAALLNGDGRGWHGELALRGGGGAVVWSLVGLSLVGDQVDDAPPQVIVHVADLSNQRAVQLALEHEATHDRLTGLPSRELFVRRLSVALESAAARRGNHLVAVLFCDLDGFKTVNDSCGHARGDQLLAITARRLAGALRLPASVARWGGDEFVVLCDGVDRVEEVTAIASRLIASASQPIVDDGLQASVSMSVGIAVARPDGQDPYGLIDAADAAMYQAKRLGAGRWVLSSSDDQLQVPAG